MKKYNYTPDIDDKNYLKKIISEKKYIKNCTERNEDICISCSDFIEKKCYKKILEINYEKLTSLYENYSRDVNFQEITAVEKESYVSLYEKQTKSTKELLGKIRENFESEPCPYCGIGGIPNTIEHILPKEIYPQYSIFSKNLIPCCAECNSRKGSKVKNSENDEYHTYNFYEDEIPNQEYLKVHIEIISNVPKAIFEISEGANILFKNHIKTLNLLERYSQNSNIIFSENQIRFKKYPIKNIDLFREECNKEYEVCKEKYGTNYYKGLLYQEMGKSREYLNYLFNNSNIQPK